MSIIYFKDTFIKRADCRISLNDRSLRFGDGLFESMLVVNGKVFDLQAHITRLNRGLKALHIMLDTKKLPKLCEELIRKNNITHGSLRILASRGEDVDGARYLPQSPQPYFLIEVFERPYPPLVGIKLWQCSYIAGVVGTRRSDSDDPAQRGGAERGRTMLAPTFKSNNSLVYVLAMMEAAAHQCDNALLLDNEGNICETATGNIFWLSGDTLYSPAASLPFIPGTMRAKALKAWKGKVTQGYFTINALKTADEIFMTGSGGIISAVTEIKPLGIKLRIGEHTKKLRAQLDKEILGA